MKRIIPLLTIALFAFACQPLKNEQNNEELNSLRMELDSLKQQVAKQTTESKQQLTTFFTFQESNAEEAMNFYVSLFENSKVTHIEKYGKEGPGKEGTIFYATFELNGSQYACSDSFIKHEWDFSPAVSNWIECKSSEELERLFTALAEGGEVMMPLDNYGFSEKFGFVADRFGVSWQLSLN